MAKKQAPKYEVDFKQRLKQRKNPYGHEEGFFASRGRRKCYLITSPQGKHNIKHLTHTEMVQLKLQGYDLGTLEWADDED